MQSPAATIGIVVLYLILTFFGLLSMIGKRPFRLVLLLTPIDLLMLGLNSYLTYRLAVEPQSNLDFAKLLWIVYFSRIADLSSTVCL